MSRGGWAAIGAVVAVTLGSGGISLVRAAPEAKSEVTPIVPCRLIDTRPGAGFGTIRAPIGAGQTVVVGVFGRNGACTIPNGATAIQVNLTALNVTAARTFVTAYPAGDPRPAASQLNPTAAAGVTSNSTVVTLSAGGQFALYNDLGSVNLIIDVVAYYTPAVGSAGEPGQRGPVGATGAQGASGVSGERGAAGVAGVAGPRGPAGVPGPAGADGDGNVPGPQGPAGPPGVDGEDGVDGADGAAGPAGPRGPAGAGGDVAEISYLQVEGPISTSGSSASRTASAVCAFGNVVVGGGFEISSSANGNRKPPFVTKSAPSSSNTWTVTAERGSGERDSWSVRAYAICVGT